jgi:hypothetical protein
MKNCEWTLSRIIDCTRMRESQAAPGGQLAFKDAEEKTTNAYRDRVLVNKIA